MIHFGTGGWRAVIGDDFTRENIMLIAQGLADWMREKKKADRPVIIGHDRRFLSDNAAEWFGEVLTANGIRVIVMSRSLPTPVVMHYVRKHGLYFGIEITASHNPSVYNGVKVIVEEGRDAPQEFTDELEDRINRLAPSDIKRLALPNGYSEVLANPFNEYMDDILALLDTDAMRRRGARVLFDPMHGSGTYPLMCILYTVRCTVDPIHFNRDAFFGGVMPAPSPTSLLDLSDQVVQGRYELGIALDGDGDRLGIIDANGRYINANQILAMLYHYLHEYKGWKGPVVRNLATTHLLDKLAADLGEQCYEVPIGFKHVSAKIDEVDAVLGGESSGGLTVRGHIHGKDSVYAASLFIEMVSVTGKTPTQYYAELEEKYGVHRMVEANLRFAPENRAKILRTVMEEKRLPTFASPVDHVGYEDGCKVYFGSGDFVICRFSGTEPLLRIFAESDTDEKAQSYIDAFRAMLEM